MIFILFIFFPSLREKKNDLKKNTKEIKDGNVLYLVDALKAFCTLKDSHLHDPFITVDISVYLVAKFFSDIPDICADPSIVLFHFNNLTRSHYYSNYKQLKNH